MIEKQKMNHKFLIIGQLPPPYHGSNVMTEMFVKSLKNTGHYITIVEKTFSRRIEEVGKASILKIFKIPLITSILIYHLIRHKHDLCFYFLSVKPPSIFVDTFFLYLIRMFRVKYILYLHGKGIVDLDDKIAGPLRSFVVKAISLSLGALVLGERLKGDVSHLIPKERLFVLPNAVPDLKSKKIEINHNRKGPVKIIFLSNLIPSKGPMEFLKMARKINKLDKNVHFFLAGPNRSNHFFYEIKEFIHNENLNGCVTLTGSIYGENKEQLFMQSDIFVFPTYYDLEAFPLVVLEAMRAGLPVVSSSEGSIPEMVIDCVNGFIIDPKDIDMLTDRVLKLTLDPVLRTKMGNAGREIYEKKFTVNSYQKRLEQGLNFFFKLKGTSDGASVGSGKSS
jgi:glycosyltransferase involved in cell wall biosynthesis